MEKNLVQRCAIQFCVKMNNKLTRMKFWKQRTNKMLRAVGRFIGDIYHYDPEWKKQSSQWKIAKSSQPKKSNNVHNRGKIMFTIIFYHNGFVYQQYYRYLQPIITATYYHDTFKIMIKRFFKKKSWKKVERILLHWQYAFTRRWCRCQFFNKK